MAHRVSRWANVVGGLVLVAGVAVWAANPLAQLGVGQKEAGELLLSAVTAGNTPYGPVVVAFKKMSPATRGALVQDLAAWAKAYTSSAAFKAAYGVFRTSRKPEAPVFEGSVDDEFRQKQAEQAAQIADSRKSLALLPADQRKQVEDMLKQSEAMMQGSEMQKMMRDGIVGERARRQEDFQRETTDWQRDYPESPNPLIAKRLHRFLEASADVDFSAALTSKDGRVVFTNPAYESKPGDWKLCFRAGREAIAAARAAALVWAKEIDGK